MDRQSSIFHRLYRSFCLYIFPLAGVLVHGLWLDADMLMMWSEGVCMFFLSVLLSVFLRFNGRKFLEKLQHPYFFWTSFGVSCILLGMMDNTYIGVFWLFGVVYACLDAGIGLGAGVYGYMMLAYTVYRVFEHRDMYPLLVWIVFGGMLTLLFANYRHRRVTIYLWLILETTFLSLEVVLFRFSIEAIEANIVSVVTGMAGILVFVIIGFIKTSAVPKTGYIESNGLSYEPFSYERALDSSYALYCLLDKHSKELLAHSERVAKLSADAIRLIGGDELLVRAGGLYHEVGRITGEDNYIKASLMLGAEMKFPKPLLDLIRQHSASFSLPESKEAAVLMFSDCILTTSDILEKKGNRENYSEQQIVHSVFQNRLKKGHLKKSTLTQEQIQVLEQFYIHHAFMEDNE